jgi:flagellin
MRISTNVASLNAQEAAGAVNRNLQSSLEKLSSGLRINKSADDASGLAIADKLRTQASSLKQSIANANSAASFIQIGDKAMAEQSNVLDIIKTKLIQAKNGTTSDEGRKAILNDIQKLLTQLDSIAEQTNYNGIKLLQGDSASSSAKTLSFQVGEKATSTISGASSVKANTTGLGLTSLKTMSSTNFSSSMAGTLMGKIDSAIDTLNTNRSNFGSTQNQLESAIRNMSTTYTNIKAAESTIRDVDYAQESANFNKQNIIAQAGTYAMSQANAIQQNVLKLLQ